jgi:hypothetical protein
MDLVFCRNRTLGGSWSGWSRKILDIASHGRILGLLDSALTPVSVTKHAYSPSRTAVLCIEGLEGTAELRFILVAPSFIRDECAYWAARLQTAVGESLVRLSTLETDWNERLTAFAASVSTEVRVPIERKVPPMNILIFVVGTRGT